MRTFMATLLLASVFTIAGASNEQTGSENMNTLIEKLQTLANTKKHNFMSIEVEGGDAIIQVIRQNKGSLRGFLLMVAFYPSNEDPSILFPRIGIDVPERFRLTQWEPDTFVEYSITEPVMSEIALFIDQVFKKYFKAGNEYKPIITFDTM